MGTEAVSRSRPAFYAPVGSVFGDLLALLHLPYTIWHLSYVVLGAALAPDLNWLWLAGTLAAFFVGTGVGAHALDEFKDRPLGTGLSDRVLLLLGAGAFAAVLALAALGAFLVSPWVVAWAILGLAIAAGYALESHRFLHSDWGFSVAWGAFPVVVGFWVQTGSFRPSLLAFAIAATLFSFVQRTLSTPAKYVRRATTSASVLFEESGGRREWSRDRLLATWERPLRLLSWGSVILSIGLLATHL